MSATLQARRPGARPAVAVTTGEPAGIGPEISLRAAWALRHEVNAVLLGVLWPSTNLLQLNGALRATLVELTLLVECSRFYPFPWFVFFVIIAKEEAASAASSGVTAAAQKIGSAAKTSVAVAVVVVIIVHIFVIITVIIAI